MDAIRKQASRIREQVARQVKTKKKKLLTLFALSFCFDPISFAALYFVCDLD